MKPSSKLNRVPSKQALDRSPDASAHRTDRIPTTRQMQGGGLE